MMSFWTRKDRKKNKPKSAPQPRSTYATHSKGCAHEYMRVKSGHNQADNMLNQRAHHSASTDFLF